MVQKYTGTYIIDKYAVYNNMKFFLNVCDKYEVSTSHTDIICVFGKYEVSTSNGQHV